jgi:hypothetical protein
MVTIKKKTKIEINHTRRLPENKRIYGYNIIKQSFYSSDVTSFSFGRPETFFLARADGDSDHFLLAIDARSTARNVRGFLCLCSKYARHTLCSTTAALVKRS